jgi:hypothetical protein
MFGKLAIQIVYYSNVQKICILGEQELIAYTVALFFISAGIIINQNNFCNGGIREAFRDSGRELNWFQFRIPL